MPAREADHDVAEAVLAHVVAQAELERAAHLLEVVERREPARGAAAPPAGAGDRARAPAPPRLAVAIACERAAAHVPQPAPDRGGRVDVDHEERLLEAPAPARPARPRRRARASAPSKISSSCPPTALQSAMKHELSRARTRSISSRSRSLPTWNGDAEMLTTSWAPASARSVAGGPGCQMSSQIVGPTIASPNRSRSEVVAGREVAVLVEDAVVRQEALAVDAADLAAGEDVAGVVEIGVEVGRADERDDPLRLGGDLLDRRRAGRADERRAQQQVLRRVAGDRELREEDEVGAGVPRRGEPVEDAGPVAVEIADDAVDLGERESHFEVFSSRSKTLARSSRRQAPYATTPSAKHANAIAVAQPASRFRATTAEHGRGREQGERQSAKPPGVHGRRIDAARRRPAAG